MENDADVVVIGAGLAGLAAATTAARSGRRVVVLEARTRPGGRARTANRRGFLVNEGAHALYRDGEGLAALRELDVEPDGAVPPPATTMGVRNGRLEVFPTGFGSLARTKLLRPGGKLELGRLLARLSRLRPEDLHSTTVTAWLDASLADPDARDVVATLIRLTTYANDPEHLSAGAAVTQLQRAASGSVLYLHGGWQGLVDALMARAESAGARIAKDTRVERVMRQGHGFAVACRDGLVQARTVVLASGGPQGPASLLETPPDEARAWAERARPAHAASLDVGVHGGWDNWPTFVLGVDRSLYLSVHTRAARLAPADDTLVSVMKYLRPGEHIDPERDRQELKEALDLVRPGWRDDAADVLFRPALVATTDTPQASFGGLPARPGPEVPGAGGVYVAGDWVGPVGILADAALASGVAAGRAAADRARMTVAA